LQVSSKKDKTGKRQNDKSSNKRDKIYAYRTVYHNEKNMQLYKKKMLLKYEAIKEKW